MTSTTSPAIRSTRAFDLGRIKAQRVLSWPPQLGADPPGRFMDAADAAVRTRSSRRPPTLRQALSIVRPAAST